MKKTFPKAGRNIIRGLFILAGILLVYSIFTLYGKGSLVVPAVVPAVGIIWGISLMLEGQIVKVKSFFKDGKIDGVEFMHILTIVVGIGVFVSGIFMAIPGLQLLPFLQSVALISYIAGLVMTIIEIFLV